VSAAPKTKCECGLLDRWAADPKSPIEFDERTQEYYLVHEGVRTPIQYCFQCGGQSADLTLAKPPHRRRWKSVALRMFAVLLLGLSALSAWFVVRVYKQHKLVQEIVAAGGIVSYKPRFDANGKPQTGGNPRIPVWLRDLFGDHVLDEPELVSFDSNGNSIFYPEFLSCIVRLNKLKTLKTVRVSGIRLSRHELEQLAEINGLENLTLDRRAVGDVDLDMLQGLPLRFLSLEHTQVSDKCMANLGKIHSLGILKLTRTRVSDNGIAKLENLPNLVLLELSRTKVTREGAEGLRAKLPHCRVGWESIDRKEFLGRVWKR
jgi:hypothetical protein